MNYIGLQEQIRGNNIKSIILLLSFPLILLGLSWVFFYITNYDQNNPEFIDNVNYNFLKACPFIIGIVGFWFLISWLTHSTIILSATSSKPLERKTNQRVYNLLENLCMSQGMKMPKLYIINDDSLNAFASGINDKTYSISLSKGIIEKLDDQELESVIAHELTHIKNKDVRLLIISIIFVGIFSFISEMAFRSIRFSSFNRNNKKGGGIVLIIILLFLSLIGYLLSIIVRFSLSRKREYLADAGAVEMTKNSLALASALRKVSDDPLIEVVKRKDVAQLFIENPSKKKLSFLSIGGLFSSHPPIENRIKLLEQF